MSWNLIITSGSDAEFNSIDVSTTIEAASISGSFSGSYEGDGSNITGIVNADTASYVLLSDVEDSSANATAVVYLDANGKATADVEQIYYNNSSLFLGNSLSIDNTGIDVGTSGFALSTSQPAATANLFSGKIYITGEDQGFRDVGINTTSPARQLDVNGQIRMRSGSASGSMIMGLPDGTFEWINPVPITHYASSTASIDFEGLPGGTFKIDLGGQADYRIELSNPLHGGLYTFHLHSGTGSGTDVTFGDGTWYTVDNTTTFTTQSIVYDGITFYYSSSAYVALNIEP